MERLATLIGKLNEQFAQNADPAQLMVTIQLIQGELNRLSVASGKTLGSSKVAVVMPSVKKYSASEIGNTAVEKEPEFLQVVEKNGTHQNAKPQEEKPPSFNPLTEVPTLAHQPGPKELNEWIGNSQSSLNDKLKEEVREIGHFLTDSPVRDLKKAIGINDRYVFISELFRGDETMYERSIKTINSFRIFPEAEYWIERELKVKLGWDDGKEITRHFYQLVKRRFS